ncbi:zinc knuckle domain protein [Moniliophthora roreri]|nr:zinc knuckle domain protein [Moniliophthora roreri]
MMKGSAEHSRECTNAATNILSASASGAMENAHSCPEAAGGYSDGGARGGKICYSSSGIEATCLETACRVGHISRDCPQPQKKACYTCGSEGHISKDCPGTGETA